MITEFNFASIKALASNFRNLDHALLTKCHNHAVSPDELVNWNVVERKKIMGHRVNAKCIECGNTFTVNHGGGFFFHLLRCDKCGKTKSVGLDQLGELHLRYMKGLSGPYCVATSEQDNYVRDHVDVEPIAEDEYHRGVESFAGKCRCGGKYVFDAPPRCPKCHSARIEEGEITVMYD